MPRVLWLGSEVTARPRSGGAIRSLRLLEALAARADVDLVTTEPSEPVPPVCASHHAGTLPSRAAVVAGALLRGRALATARSVSPATVAAARRLAAGADHVVLEWVHLAPLLPAGPYVLSLHNVEAERLADTPPAADPLRRRLQRRDARLVAATERRLAHDPRATVVCVSDRDRDLLGVAAHVVANGTDVPERVTPVPEEGDVVFVGAMGYPPNRAAVEWWAAEVWPLARVPLTVAGRDAQAALAHLADHPGLRITGEVADVAPVLARAALVAVPLRHGGGTRLKVLEAFAAGRPVVSTAKGVEGLDTAGAGVVADGAAAFAQAVTGLLADLPRRRALAAAGRDVATRHDWRALGTRFADVVLASPGRRT